MKNKATAIIAYTIVISIILCSCTKVGYYESSSDYETTLEMYTHPNGGGREGWRYVYDENKNEIIPITNEKINVGARSMFYCDSQYLNQVEEMAAKEDLGQFNEYMCFGDLEVFLYWKWTDTYKNTLITVENGNIKTISLPKGNDLRLCYYHESILYLIGYITWNTEETVLSGTLITVDTKTEKVTQHNLTVYDQSIENSFKISEKLKYPISEWKNKDISMAGYDMELTDDSIIICLSLSYSVFGASSFIPTYWLQKYNIKTRELEHMDIVNEGICGFEKSENGYTVFSYIDSSTGISRNDRIERLWMKEYDENLNIINSVEIDCNAFTDVYSVTIYKHADKAYIIARKDDDTNTVFLYNINENTLVQSKNSIKGYLDDFRLVKKADGKIQNII